MYLLFFYCVVLQLTTTLGEARVGNGGLHPRKARGPHQHQGLRQVRDPRQLPDRAGHAVWEVEARGRGRGVLDFARGQTVCGGSPLGVHGVLAAQWGVLEERGHSRARGSIPSRTFNSAYPQPARLMGD